MLFHCKVCGKEGACKKSENKKYCSNACFQKTLSPRIKFICKNCGKEGECTPTQNKKYCNQKCVTENYHKNQKKYICRQCGKIAWQQRCGKQILCGQACRAKYLNTSKNRQYPVGWNAAFKAIIRERDNFTCRICEKHESDFKKKLQIHHINYDKHDVSLNNLISLCVNCHIKKAHGKDKLLWKEKLSKLLEEQEMCLDMSIT